MIVVGITSNIIEAELLGIVGTAENVFIADNFTHLASAQFIENVTKGVCQLGMYLKLPTYNLHHVYFSILSLRF